MDSQLYYKKSPNKLIQEDACFIHTSMEAAGVFDGVTPIDAYKNSKGENGAVLASHLFKRYFQELFTEKTSPKEGIAAANRLLKEKMQDCGIDLSEKPYLWSTCAAVVRAEEDVISFAQAGDCMIAARMKDGRVRELVKNSVKGISARAKTRRENERDEGKGIQPEHYYQQNPAALYADHRSMANTEDGYSVCNGEEALESYIQEGSIEKKDVDAILLISDGFFIPGEETLQKAVEFACQKGLPALAEFIEQKEKDANLPPDDRTAILIRFN
ncbi:protein phosphatase 2C domain-containing protein [Metabacillus sp. GX 13764]|uniref:protein phosphatase 2C domain-containing protein n=1 Tax=Metabacillus kandeliae TaxID=2900151 RepID=UPI001E3E782A|nr:protein phosphatase 2C domain-containing protein [Metabacillus kandeliae]MCD7033525.1 protein phosphatase 2C domain-containing protein [Metabacillus kandeliae]